MDQHLAVYHIKSEFAEKYKDSLKLLLRKPREVRAFNPNKKMPYEAQLFVSKLKKKSKLKQPSWVAFLEKGFAKLPVPKTQSIGAVLFVRIPYKEEKKKEEKELFAFTFGAGRHLLNPKSYDGDYGLRVALNVIYKLRKPKEELDPNRLRSVAMKTIAANTIRTKKQTDRQASFETFGVDTRHDDLNAVTGTPVAKVKFWGKPLSGSESLATTAGVTLRGLKGYCKALVDMRKQDTYDEQGFGWIDNRRKITDLGMIDKLNKKIIKTLIKTPKKITLTVPEIIEWEKVDHFSFSFDKKEFSDPGGVDLNVDLVEALELKKIKKVEGILHVLRKEYLIAENGQDDEEGSWPLLNCLSGEIVNKEQTYILCEGEFFEVNKNFLKGINDFVGSLPLKEDFLPCCSAGTCEGDYNEETAKNDESLLLLDKKTVRVTGRTTPIEICDLLKGNNCFIHVKRNLHSSDLSHLFAQGFVSAELLLRSQDYRLAALARIRKEAGGTSTTATGAPSYVTPFSFSPGEITPGDFEVLYAIIADWKRRNLVEALPFFSKVNLRRYAEDLRRMGFKVSVARVEYKS